MLVALLLCLSQTMWAQVQPATLEYWLDDQFASRQSQAAGAALQQTIDVSQLRLGIHALGMRISDTQGRWSAPFVRFFLKSDPTVAANGLATYEYWIDDNRDAAVSGPLQPAMTLDVDVAALRPGMHRLQLKVSDSQGRQGQTVNRFFLVPGEDLSRQQLTAVRYWIDDFGKAQQGAIADGSLLLDIDVSQLCKGVHTLGYQVADEGGRMSAPRLLYFVVPDLESGCDQLTAYEYWFNHGPRQRVELPAASQQTVKDVVIEVKDVLPNQLDGYRFDVASEMVSVDDQVFFGLQAFNGAGIGSQAVLSEAFPMTVPVDPHFLPLNDGEQQTFDAPTRGKMQGLKTTTAAGDSLVYYLSVAGLHADFYDANGSVIKAERNTLDEGGEVFVLKSTTATTYALVYGASRALKKLTATVSVGGLSTVASMTTGIDFRTARHRLSIETDADAELTITNTAGQVLVRQSIGRGSTSFTLPAGIYLVGVGRSSIAKVLVP